GSGDARRYSAVGEGEQVDVDAARLTDAESAAIDRFVTALATLPGRRHRSSPAGERIDARRALRASLETGGAAVDLPRTEPTASELRCCLLIDVSGSVLDTVDRSVLLAFAERLSATARDARVFLFDTDLIDATEAFARADGDPSGALRDAAVEWGGGTKIGRAFTTLRREHPHAVDRRTVVVVVSDGLDVGERSVLENGITWLSGRAGSLVWLNPLAVSPSFEPRSRGMATSAPYLDALFGFAEPADIDEAARQIERRGLDGRVGYEYDPRRHGSTTGGSGT
ncbi:VWA domain-containing protein, partial [Haloplanus sp.]|uniref:VWA domain-containing protein n=1 Tax=Haloplanus sp. TaxID=1961696 RepID=UPI00261EA261